MNKLFKNLGIIIATFSLAACGGTSGMSESAFEEKAAALDRSHDYTGAELAFSVEMKVNGKAAGSATATATYTFTDGAFETTNSTLPSGYETMANLINVYQIDNVKSVVAMLETAGLNATISYSGTDTALSATIKGSVSASESGISVTTKATVTIDWDEHGLVKKAVEVDEIKVSGNGQSATQWGKSVCTFTYTK